MKNLKKTLDKKRTIKYNKKGRPIELKENTYNLLKGIKNKKSWEETFLMLINFYLNNN